MIKWVIYGLFKDHLSTAEVR